MFGIHDAVCRIMVSASVLKFAMVVCVNYVGFVNSFSVVQYSSVVFSTRKCENIS